MIKLHGLKTHDVDMLRSRFSWIEVVKVAKVGVCNAYAVNSHGSSQQIWVFVMVTQSIVMDRVSK